MAGSFVLVATPLVAWLRVSRSRNGGQEMRGPGPDASDDNFPARVAAGSAKVWWRDASLFAAPSALMVVAWLGFNWIYFGDPLEFQRGIWSAQSQQAVLAAQGQVPTAGHFWLSVWYYLGRPHSALERCLP